MMDLHSQPKPVLLVQSTGSGKSSIPLICAIVDGGVTIIIENTLALSSDQASKVDNQVNQNIKNVCAFQLELFKTSPPPPPQQQQQLLTSICSKCSADLDLSIVIFLSPKTLLLDVWIKFIKELVSQKLLQLLCIDKTHLFV